MSKRKEAGVNPLPDKETFRPNRRDKNEFNTVTPYVHGVAKVGDFGAPRGGFWSETTSPASASFVAPSPTSKPSAKPEEPITLVPGVKRH